MSDSLSFLPPEFFPRLTNALHAQFPAVDSEEILSLMYWEWARVTVRTQNKKPRPVPDDPEGYLSQKCGQWLSVAVQLQSKSGTNLPEVMALLKREIRRLEKKMAGKNRRLIKDENTCLREQCEYYLLFRQRDPEREWKLAMQRNEDGAWKRLYAESHRHALALLRKKGCPDEETAKSVYQDAVYALLQQLNDPDFFIDQKVSGYLTTLALYTWYKAIRKDGKMVDWQDFYADVPEQEGDDEPLGTDNFLTVDLYLERQIIAEMDLGGNERELLDRTINSHLEKLEPDRYRTVLVERYRNGLDYAQIAAKLNIKANYARGLVFRALNKLREDLGTDFVFNYITT